MKTYTALSRGPVTFFELSTPDRSLRNILVFSLKKQEVETHIVRESLS